MSERAVPPPMALLHGRPLGWLELPWNVWLLLPLGASGAAARALAPGVAGVVPEEVAGLALLGGGAGLLLLAHAWASARTGAAEVFPDRVVVRSGAAVRVVRLAGVVTFDDRASDCVRLRVAPDGRSIRRFAVPAPPGEARAALVDALAAAGVPRAERGLLRRRRASPPRAAPLLVVRTARPSGGARAGELVWFGLLALVAAASCVGLLFLPLLWSGLPRSRVVLRPDGVDLIAGRVWLAWDDVVGWRDDGPDRVRLVLRPGLLRGSALDGWPLATPTPDVRARVEGVLAARGVPRV
ncbi:MAG: hypothetical protein M9894_07070 [Planctomycetes bacterium]|nr:hypothetical protein [Planctomycetota bacterium]